MDSNIAPQKDLQSRIFEKFARKSRLIISLFHIFYYLLIVFYLASAYFIVTKSNYFDLFYEWGKHFGQFAITLLGLVVLPGILGRFKIEIKLTRVITLFRRQLGITVFLFGFIHYSFIRLLPQISGIFPFNIPSEFLFENLGVIAISILFLMFLTSNNNSVRKMGIWWKRLHRFVYVAVWVLVFHIGLQKISIWTLGIGTIAILETLSFIFEYFGKKSNISNQIDSTTTASSGNSNGDNGQNADIS